jgi:hypothetical protein
MAIGLDFVKSVDENWESFVRPLNLDDKELVSENKDNEENIETSKISI